MKNILDPSAIVLICVHKNENAQARMLGLRLLLAGIFSVFILSSCSSAPQTTESAKTLRIATSFKIQTLEPHKSASYFLIEFGAAETLLFADDNGNIKPHLLESCAQIDEKNWRLIVRPNVFFHNGKPLTAEKLAAAMNFQLKNSPATQTLLSETSVKQTGEREIVLTTETPNPNIPAALADETGFLVFDAECIESASGAAEKIIQNGCYTGAYKLIDLDDREMNLERSANYWQGTPPLERIVVKFVPDAQVRVLSVQSNEADIALYPSSEAKRMLENQTNAFFKQSENSNGGARIFFNVKRAPFDDSTLRRAVGLGVKYQSIAEEIFDGTFKTADGFYPPNVPFAVQNQKTDTAQAEKLLDENGWRKRADGLREKNSAAMTAILLTYPQQPDWVTLATAIQANLREIGVNVKIRQVEDIRAALKTDDWDFGIVSPGILTNGGAPDSLLRDYLTTGGASNFGGVSDSELDNLIETLSRTFDAEKRGEILRRIQQIVIAEKAFEIRPAFSRSRVVVGRRYKNYQPSPRLHHVTFETKPDVE